MRTPSNFFSYRLAHIYSFPPTLSSLLVSADVSATNRNAAGIGAVVGRTSRAVNEAVRRVRRAADMAGTSPAGVAVWRAACARLVPRIDVPVSSDAIHLVKAPMAAHQSTGSLAIPISRASIGDTNFDLVGVPQLSPIEYGTAPPLLVDLPLSFAPHFSDAASATAAFNAFEAVSHGLIY